MEGCIISPVGMGFYSAVTLLVQVNGWASERHLTSQLRQNAIVPFSTWFSGGQSNAQKQSSGLAGSLLIQPRSLKSDPSAFCDMRYGHVWLCIITRATANHLGWSESHESYTFPHVVHADLVSKYWLILGALPLC